MSEVGERVEGAWSDSLCEVFREIVQALPKTTTLGELVEATRNNNQMTPVLGSFSVQELIEAAKVSSTANDLIEPNNAGDELAELSTGADESGVAVIRRRADVPDGDLRVLRTLACHKAGKRGSELLQITGLASEQMRLILRFLRTKGYLHIDGSGIKRKYRITRHGSAFLRKQDRQKQSS